MKLLNYVRNGGYRLGIHTDAGIIDVAGAAAASGQTELADLDIHQAISGGDTVLDKLLTLTDFVTGKPDNSHLLLDENGLTFGPAVNRPGKILCVGLNYRKHAEETGSAIPQTPILFSKFSNALAGHLEDVPLPAVSQQVDYEAELAIVIGRTASNISKEEALDYVFGYCCANDLSARDLQFRTQQWLLGKTCDKFAPVGPYLVTADEVREPNALSISCYVNGEVRQASNTSDMIFHCDEIISFASQHMTLEPGDIILTGTPEGVVLGYPTEKQVYLQAGDVVTVEIEKLGRLTNTMTAL
ncbi:5-carboxymethyl-2-hydroxymuconate isomerase [Paenibacillus sp. FSL R7-0273]|uniref:fumarylacetoacetate hydrolase family protein n=1 Tax=Paenibacillus sp. FSL R7-0273 TaxID=1536772 RepID=UPI0004F81677|nr:fumarylacetoacetate hydrolase family protein [Paenibacillus sp. FSL R7-0273]AIQ47180.1 5-carboxymethyl-2-hydroxymuconate isomerase [Paenibacillus sp. FSL R7-0273]OMF91504.1 5-carboxymethyl-2-hydroxymuconate isomerase [Paenibacillus sp. FSL R7-0273]